MTSTEVLVDTLQCVSILLLCAAVIIVSVTNRPR